MTSREKALRELVAFIQEKRIYILAEFETGGRRLIELADKAILDAPETQEAEEAPSLFTPEIKKLLDQRKIEMDALAAKDGEK